MAQPNKYTPQTSFAGDVRTNKPGRDLINAGALDRELRHIRVTANGLCDNLALLQRDDGKLKDAAVGVHTLHKDVLMLLGKYELFGLWEANRPYLQGYVVEHEGKLYVCAESHDANDAMDLSKFKAFGTAGGGALTGDYLPVNWAESFFADDADGLTAAGVYVLADNGEASYLVVLGNGENVGQLRITPAGLRVRFQTASGWWDWVDLSRVDLPAATLEQAGIVMLAADIEGGADDKAATPAAVKAEFSKVGVRLDSLAQAIGAADDGAASSLAELPAGAVAYFDLAEPPAGWLVADGSVVSNKVYPDLFAAIGYRYGNGSNVDDFKLPDARGEFIRGWDKGRGKDVERALGTMAAGKVGVHQHGTGRFDGQSGVAVDDAYLMLGNWSDGTKYTMRLCGGDAQRKIESTNDGLNIGIISSLPVNEKDGGYPDNWALLCCIKAQVGRLTVASDTRAGVVKLYQSTDGHESAFDGALSVRGAKALADESSKWQNLTGVPDSFKPSGHRHGWAEIDDKPSKFTPAAHKHTWADITGAPEWVLKSDYEAKIKALEARLAALENPAGG